MISAWCTCAEGWEEECELREVIRIGFMKPSRFLFDFVLRVLRSLWKIESRRVT